jgi:uncharacterized membrane protein
MSTYAAVLTVHIAAGLGCVFTGFGPLLTRKGSRAHRWAGRVFVALMTALLACAWVMTAMKPDTYLLALSATASLTLFSGVRVLGRKRPDMRRRDRAHLLDWAVTLAIIGVGLLVLGLVLTGRNDGPTAISIALVYGALSMGVWDLWRFARPADWPFSPELWRYEHLWKMIGAWSAVLSAFSGNFLTFVPQPWSALWPTIVFQPLMVVWIAVLILERRRRAPVMA